MKHFELLYDNTYNVIYNDASICNSKHNAKLYLIDIGTKTKGPIYTIVTDPIRDLQTDEI